MSSIDKVFNPFPGLRPFNMDEDYLFFGREQQITDLLTLLRKHRFLAVVGTSGSGKSSVVRAGLLPEVLGGGMSGVGSAWEIALMRPGGNPVGNLAKSLCQAGLYDEDDADTLHQLTATLTRSSLGLVEAVRQSDIEDDVNLLIVVDQFEEIFRFHQRSSANEDVAAAFVNLLLQSSKQNQHSIYIVLTMRSDFLGDCAQFRGLAEAINDGEYLIPRLSRQQLQSAIEGPVKVGGGEISFRLVQELLNDVGRDQDQLPVLQHALMRTWEFWEVDRDNGQVLDLCHYESAGGMQQALSRHADEIFEGLPSDRLRLVAEHLFKAVTEFGADNRGIRRPVRLERLCAIINATQDEATQVISAFRKQGRTFLMPMENVELTRETVVDLSHESLMRVWQRLRGWVDEEAASARIYRRLAETAVLHHDDRAGLYRDPDLQIALDWRERTQPTQEWARRYHSGFDQALRFLDVSNKAKQAEIEAHEAARKHELEQAQKLAETESAHAAAAVRAARRLRYLAVVMAVVALTAIVASVAAIVLKQQADVASRAALANEAEAKQAANEANRAKEEAEAAEREAKIQSARADEEAKNAQAALDENERAKRAQYFHQITLANWAWRSDDIDKAKEFLSGCPHELRNWEWGYLNRLCNLKTISLVRGSNQVQSACFSEDSRYLALAYDDGSVAVWDVPKAKQIHTLKAHTERVTAVAFSGIRLASASADNSVKLWNARSGKELYTLNGHTEPVRDVSFSRNGRLLASASEDDTVRIWSVYSGQETGMLSGHTDDVLAVVFGPHSIRLASGCQDGTIKVWNVNSREEVIELTGHEDSVSDLIFGADMNQLRSVSNDMTLRQWDVANRRVLRSESRAGAVQSVALSTDWRRIATASDDQTVTIWDATAFEKIRTLKRHPDPVALAFSPDGKWLATAGREVRLTEQEDIKLTGHGQRVRGVAFSPDGLRLASVGLDKTLRFWDTSSGKSVSRGFDLFRRFGLVKEKEHQGEIFCVAYSPDGQLLATSSQDQTIKLRHAKTGQIIRTLKHSANVRSVSFSPDSRQLASACNDRRIRLWDAATGTEIKKFTGHTDFVTCVAFSSDGQRLASSSMDRTVKIWDIAAGRESSTLDDHSDIVITVVFSPDGKYIASAGADKIIKLRDSTSGDVMGSFVGHTNMVLAIAFSPDSKRLVSTGFDSTIRLWEVTTGQEIRNFRGHLGPVHGIAFGPHGRKIASAGWDGNVMLWDAWLLKRIVPPTANWKWLHPTSGADPAEQQPHFHTSFFMIDFDDSNWSDGQDSIGPYSGFGYAASGFEGVDIGTPDPPNRQTAYFRHRFETETAYDNLILNMRRDVQLDDGVIVYLDGTEVLSDNIPDEAPESYELLGSRTSESRFQMGVLSFEIPVRIEPGEHVLAISLHNNENGDPNMRISEISLEGRDVAGMVTRGFSKGEDAELRPNQPASVESTSESANASTLHDLQASSFEHSDPDVIHQRSLWQVRRSTSGTFSPPIIVARNQGDLTSYSITPETLLSTTTSSEVLQPATTYFWRVAYEDSNGKTSRYSREASFTTRGTRIISAGSTWKWLHPHDGIDPAMDDDDFHSTFFTLDFEDSQWQTGQDSSGPEGGFGYGDSVGVRFRIPKSSDRKTAYFRHTFLTDETYQNLVLKLQRDDGIIVYLDGVEVLRDNVSNAPEAYHLFAESTTSGSDEIMVHAYDLSTTLEPGDHVLAISLHNRAYGSSDLRLAEISLVGIAQVKTDHIDNRNN